MKFERIASHVARWAGSKWALLAAVTTIVIWGVAGPFCRYSDTWQLVINTLTTLVTFVMGFVIQGSQNRDGKATHLKLDEIIRSLHSADNKILIAEDLPEDELDRLIEHYKALREERGKTKAPEIRHEPGQVRDEAGEGPPPA